MNHGVTLMMDEKSYWNVKLFLLLIYIYAISGPWTRDYWNSILSRQNRKGPNCMKPHWYQWWILCISFINLFFFSLLNWLLSYLHTYRQLFTVNVFCVDIVKEILECGSYFGYFWFSIEMLGYFAQSSSYTEQQRLGVINLLLEHKGVTKLAQFDFREFNTWFIAIVLKQ